MVFEAFSFRERFLVPVSSDCMCRLGKKVRKMSEYMCLSSFEFSHLGFISAKRASISLRCDPTMQSAEISLRVDEK